MHIRYELTPEALDDLDVIWSFIAKDNPGAASRVESAILAACSKLSQFPDSGNHRPYLTSEPVRFLTVARFPNYCIVYLPDTKPLQVVAILQGNRDLQTLLRTRL